MSIARAPAAAALFVAAVGLYSYTAAPDLSLVDSAELALACTTGGVAHPPGVPLYLILGRVFSRLPVDTPARALNLMSAFLAAISVAGLFLTTERSLAFAERSREGGAAVRLLAAATAALAFLTSRNPWTWAGVTEVYALNMALLSAAWFAAWAVVVALTARGARGVSPGAWRGILAACLLASLGLANHHATAALLFPVFLMMILLTVPRLVRTTRFLLTLAASLVGSLSLYLYLLVAARVDPALSWGGVTSISLLIRHVTGQQYRLQVGSVPGESAQVARDFGELLLLGCGLPAAIVILVGLPLALRFLKTNRARALVVGVPVVLILLNLLLSVNYIAGPEDRMAYDLPATAAYCLLLGVAVWAILASLRGASVAVGIGLLLLVTVWNGARNFEACNLHSERTARTYVEEILEAVPRGSVVVTTEWNFYAPFLYMRHVEGYRPDVHVVDALMLRRWWYLRYLERSMPELIDPSRDAFVAYQEQIDRFDFGLSYDQFRIQTIYDTLLLRWLEVGKAGGGAFVDWACLEKPQELSWIQTQPTLPSGLLLRFVDDPAESAPPIGKKNAENLRYVRSRITDRTVRGDLSDIIARHDPYRKVWNTYQRSVESSLLFIAGRGEQAFTEYARDYETWFPEMDLAVQRVLQRMGN